MPYFCLKIIRFIFNFILFFIVEKTRVSMPILSKFLSRFVNQDSSLAKKILEKKPSTMLNILEKKKIKIENLNQKINKKNIENNIINKDETKTNNSEKISKKSFNVRN